MLCSMLLFYLSDCNSRFKISLMNIFSTLLEGYFYDCTMLIRAVCLPKNSSRKSCHNIMNLSFVFAIFLQLIFDEFFSLLMVFHH